MSGSGKRWPGWLICGAAVLAYLPMLRNGWVWDDDRTLFDNPLIQAPDGLVRFWFTRQAPDYWPVTYSDLWVEWRLWGAHPFAFHLGALALHVLACLTLWAVLRRLAVPGALLAAVLFAVHPVNVEAVAWIADRKDLLATLFFLLSILGWLQLRPTLSLAAFALAMLSKGSAAPLPLVLLGITLYRRRRDGLRLVPFFVLSAGLALVNVWFETHRAGAIARPGGLTERALGAAAAGWFYLEKAVLPWNLMFIYPQWHVTAAAARWWIPLLAAGLVTAFALRAVVLRRHPWCEGLGWAWVYFWVVLAPVLGFADVYFMRYALVANHYEHLALAGAVAVEGALLSLLWTRAAAFRWLVVAVPCAWAAGTFGQCFDYRNEETLYRRTLAANPAAWLAHTNLGNLLVGAGRLPEALVQFDAALKLRPGDVETENDEGAALARIGRLDEAIRHYQAALRIDPRSVQANYNWGLALCDERKLPDAAIRFREALRWAPGFTEARDACAGCYNDTGCALLQQGRLDEALARFHDAEAVRPDLPQLHYNLGVTLARLGRLDDSAREFRRELQANPGDRDAQQKLAAVLAVARRRGSP